MTAVRAARIDSPRSGRVVVGEHEVPEPGPGEVLVRSVACGICGSDVELLEGTRPAGFCRYPVIPGHEWSGVVEAVGPRGGSGGRGAAAGVSVGDRVACEGMFRCGTCGQCRSGAPNLCEAGYDELGFTVPGGLAEYVLVPAPHVHRLPDTLPFDAAALLEPAAVVAHAFLRVPPVTGRTVAVVGDGTLGQIAAQLARAGGARRVTVVGLAPDRLALAARLGADEVLDAREETGLRADVVVETAGSAAAVGLALRTARRGGAVALTGIAGEGARITLDSDVFTLSGITVVGIIGATPVSFDHAIALAAAGRLRLGELVTHRFALDAAADAFAVAAARAPGTLKVLVTHAR